MPGLCLNCREQPATEVLRRYAWLPWLFIDGFDFRDALCTDCSGGKEFVSLFCYVALLVAGFTLVAIAWP